MMSPSTGPRAARGVLETVESTRGLLWRAKVSETLKFYPRPVPILVLLTGSVGLLWGGLWLTDHAATLAQSWDMPAAGKVLQAVASLLAGVGFVGSMGMLV